VSRVDQGVGRLVQMLKDTGKYDNTIILYLSDNGVAFPGAKTTLYDPGLRVPLIVRLPGGPTAGRTTRAMVSLADLTPTLLDLAGAQTAGLRLDGRSFTPLFREPDAAGWDEVYGTHTFHEVEMYYPMRMVRTRRYKLIYNVAHELTFPFAEDLYYASTWIDARRAPARPFGRRPMEQFLHRPRIELYDLKADPDETHNLAGDRAHAQIEAELVAKLKAFQSRTGDPWLRKWSFQ
jgi:N-sulfoglucosamine sulfohydrolase